MDSYLQTRILCGVLLGVLFLAPRGDQLFVSSSCREEEEEASPPLGRENSPPSCTVVFLSTDDEPQ